MLTKTKGESKYENFKKLIKCHFMLYYPYERCCFVSDKR